MILSSIDVFSDKHKMEKILFPADSIVIFCQSPDIFLQNDTFIKIIQANTQ